MLVVDDDVGDHGGRALRPSLRFLGCRDAVRDKDDDHTVGIADMKLIATVGPPCYLAQAARQPIRAAPVGCRDCSYDLGSCVKPHLTPALRGLLGCTETPGMGVRIRSECVYENGRSAHNRGACDACGQRELYAVVGLPELDGDPK